MVPPPRTIPGDNRAPPVHLARKRLAPGDVMKPVSTSRRFSVPLRRLLLGQTALLGLCAAPVLAQDSTAYELAPILVQEDLQYSGAISGYLAPVTETGVKSGVPLAQVPQSISVVTSTEIEERAPQQVEDALAYVPGVQASTWGTDDRFDQFSIRGFDVGSNAFYRDGLPQKVLNFSAFTTDPYMIERIDVLRGPAGVLYGSNDAGGMVNLVTKRPTFGHLGEVQLGYDSTGTARLGFDWSDVLSKDGTLAGRLTGLWQEGETDVSESENDRRFLAGSLTWAPTDSTSITVLAHVQRDNLTPIIFSPENGTDVDPSWGVVPDDWGLEQSDYNHFTTEQQSVGWDITHAFNASLTFNQKLRYAHQTTDYAQLDFSYADQSGMNYYAFRNDEEARTLGLDNSLEWKTQFGETENSLIGGFDYQRSRAEVTQYIDYSTYTVGYADPSFDFPVSDPGLGSVTRTDYTEKGIYLQDHLRFAGGTTLTAGLRHSWLDTKVTDELTGTSDSQSDEATTGMLGLTHDFANGLTPYISYSEGFIQNYGKTITGEALDPSKSRQWEMGLRYTPRNDLMFSAALFDLTKTNVKEYDYNDPTWGSFTQAGEVRSRGIELEARGRLNGQLQGMISYTYLDTEITRSTDSSLVGNQNAMAPHHQVALWLDYDADQFVPGLRIGSGVRYVSSFYATQANGRKTPGYTLADLRVSYEMDQTELTLGATNLFDRNYAGVCYDDYGCSLGEGRTVSLTLSRKF